MLSPETTTRPVATVVGAVGVPKVVPAAVVSALVVVVTVIVPPIVVGHEAVPIFAFDTAATPAVTTTILNSPVAAA